MLIGINIGLIVIGIVFWKIGWRLQSFSKLPQSWNPWAPALVALAGSCTIAMTEPALWLANFLGGVFGMFNGGNFILGCIVVALLFFAVFGLFDGSLDKRDIAAIAFLPTLTLAVGGIIGQGANTVRGAASDATMSIITTLVG